MLFRILTAAATSVAILGGAEQAQPDDSVARQKLLMDMEGFEKDTVLEDMTYRDAVRLDAYETVRAMAIKEAKNGGSAETVERFEEIVARPSLPFDDFNMTGEWQCRTIKAGGLAALVIYDWFRCRVTEDGSGWALEKLTGSQRTKGRFFTDGETRLIYLGSFFTADETPPAYGKNAEADQAGYVFRDAEDGWRIEFPAPARESKLDIIEFRRSG